LVVVGIHYSIDIVVVGSGDLWKSYIPC